MYLQPIRKTKTIQTRTHKKNKKWKHNKTWNFVVSSTIYSFCHHDPTDILIAATRLEEDDQHKQSQQSNKTHVKAFHSCNPIYKISHSTSLAWRTLRTTTKKITNGKKDNKT